jgi:uncharacterized sodium:solute symporter family permease YidK
VLIGGMWINNLNYWGCNQYITQRALGANLAHCACRDFIRSISKIVDTRDCRHSRHYDVRHA